MISFLSGLDSGLPEGSPGNSLHDQLDVHHLAEVTKGFHMVAVSNDDVLAGYQKYY